MLIILDRSGEFYIDQNNKCNKGFTCSFLIKKKTEEKQIFTKFQKNYQNNTKTYSFFIINEGSKLYNITNLNN